MNTLPSPSLPLAPAPTPGEPCYSARLLGPFLAVLRESPRIPRAAVDRLEALEPEQRIYVSYVHSLLRLAEDLVDDPALGLKASAAMTTGDAGMFDFLLTSSDTPRMAIQAGARYLRLISDAHELSLTLEGELAWVRFESRVPFPSAAEDFALASLIRNHIFGWPDGMLEETDAWFQHEAPRDFEPYRELLGPVRLHFEATRGGFSFPAHYLDAPLRKRDARLHSVLRAAADDTLASMPLNESTTERVKRLIGEQLASQSVGLIAVARQLRMHPRKLSRTLVREGTTFERALEDVRRTLALSQLAHGDLSIEQIATLTGFSGKAPFHRAFRRWTAETPLEYRRRHRGDRGVRLLRVRPA